MRWSARGSIRPIHHGDNKDDVYNKDGCMTGSLYDDDEGADDCKWMISSHMYIVGKKQPPRQFDRSRCSTKSIFFFISYLGVEYRWVDLGDKPHGSLGGRPPESTFSR